MGKPLSIVSSAAGLRGPAVLMAMLAAACGGGSGTHSPVAPTAALAGSGGSSTGATIGGTVVTGIGAASFRPAAAATITVSVAGTGMSSPVDSSGSFLLVNVPSGHVQLQITGPGIQAQVDLGDVAEHETVRITINVSGTTADVDDTETETPGSEAQLEGRVTKVGTGMLTVGTVDVTVPSGVTIRHGDTTLTLADVHTGDLVHVQGSRSGSVFIATQIIVQTSNGNPGEPEPGDDHGHDNEVELNGTIAGLSSTSLCPAISFTVSSTTVTTNASTEFKGASCSQLANGQRVEVKGTKQSNGSVLAIRVEAEKDDN